MAANGWNSAGFGMYQSRPYQSGSSSTMIACRLCDKIFLSAYSLVEHCESHHSDFVNQMQNPQRTNSTWDYHRERSNLFQQQAPQHRPHPYAYLPSGYQGASSSHVPTQNPFLVPTPNPQVTNLRSHMITSGLVGGGSGAGASLLVANRPTEAPGSYRGPPVRLEYQKGYDETADKRTKWYLGQLERPIPKVTDLENRNKSPSTSYRF